MHQAEAFEATDTTRLRRCNNDVTDVLAVRTIMSKYFVYMGYWHVYGLLSCSR